MALHLAANGCYGVMIYNNKDYPDSYINDELKKYGKVHELQKGGKNLIFIYYKQYEEARACLDALSSDPEFNAKPAKPRETNRSDVPSGARVRAKSVTERGDRSYAKEYETRKNFDPTVGSPKVNGLRERSMSISSINVEKVDSSTSVDKTESPEKSGATKESGEQPKVTPSEAEREEIIAQKTPFRPRSKSIGRINVEDEAKRAELIKKVIKCESKQGGSLDSLFEKEISPVDNSSNQEEKNEKCFPHPRLQRSKSFHGDLHNVNNHKFQNYSSYRQKNLWLSPKPNFNRPRDGYKSSKSDENEPYLLPAMTIYEHYIIANKREKQSHVVVISGLPLYITEEYLCDLCSKFARVLQIRLAKTQRIEERRAYVYVESRRDAVNLRKNIDRRILFCHIVHVTLLSDIDRMFTRY